MIARPSEVRNNKCVLSARAMAESGDAEAKKLAAKQRKDAATAKIELDWKQKLNDVITENRFQQEISEAYAITENRFQQEISEAYAHLQSSVPLKPEGVRSPIREPKQIRDFASAGGKQIISGGSLGMLNLKMPAHNVVQHHKIQHVLKEKWTGYPDSVGDMLVGTIAINFDMWMGDQLVGLARASHDSEPGPLMRPICCLSVSS